MCERHFHKKLFQKWGEKKKRHFGTWHGYLWLQKGERWLWAFSFFHYLTSVASVDVGSGAQQTLFVNCQPVYNVQSVRGTGLHNPRKHHTGRRTTKTRCKSLQEPPSIKGMFAYTAYPRVDVSRREDSISEHACAALQSWLWLTTVEERISQPAVPPTPNILPTALRLSFLRNFTSPISTLGTLPIFTRWSLGSAHGPRTARANSKMLARSYPSKQALGLTEWPHSLCTPRNQEAKLFAHPPEVMARFFSCLPSMPSTLARFSQPSPLPSANKEAEDFALVQPAAG